MIDKIFKLITDLINQFIKKPRILSITTNSKYKHVQKFIKDFSGMCIVAGDKYNLPAELMLAQIAEEVGWHIDTVKGIDNTGEMLDSMNLFNIKCGTSWSGDYIFKEHVQEFIDGEEKFIPDSFRKYKSYQDSINDYCKLITTLKRYDKCKTWNGNIDKYLDGLKEGGYATGKNYIEHINKILKMFVIKYNE